MKEGTCIQKTDYNALQDPIVYRCTKCRQFCVIEGSRIKTCPYCGRRVVEVKRTY